ncbi:MAG: protease [Planctomycetes bacterium]|nr:protease [Planctomycetota bacterium]NOG55372.1 protease [Planctomycetota bacterium]
MSLTRPMIAPAFTILLLMTGWVGTAATAALAQKTPPAKAVGYYRNPAIHDNTIVFVAEGDLWKTSVFGGAASRLTSHPGDETNPAISPDGTTVAFTGEYEGPAEVYTMPIEGGLPTRFTYDANRGLVAGWTPDNRIIYICSIYSTLPRWQMVLLDPATGDRELLPLAQAAGGCIDEDGQSVFFTRVPFQGSHTKRYKGGTAQTLWRFDLPTDETDPAAVNEAVHLTGDYPGTSRNPMCWDGRVYFESDRNETMNVWSMKPDGSDLQQHTFHVGWDVKTASLGQGRIVYQLGGDIRLFDITAGTDRMIPITLDSDFDQTREKWVTSPIDYLTSAHLSPDGDRVVLTARGEVFVMPHGQGRLVQATRRPDVRYRTARFTADGERILTLSDESGEIEFWTLPTDGTPDDHQQLTTDGVVLRWDGIPSTDGTWIAHYDKNFRLWLFNVDSGEQRLIDQSDYDDFSDLAWSPDNKWLAYVKVVHNQNHVIRLYHVDDAITLDLTSDRYDSRSPAWDPDGEWVYFLSDRNFRSLVRSPWGPRQPEPFFDRETELFMAALQPGLRSPFEPDTELTRQAEQAKEEDEEKETNEDDASATDDTDAAQANTEDTADEATADESQEDGTDESAEDSEAADGDDEDEGDDEADKAESLIEIEAEGLQERLYRIPVAAGNYGNLMATADHLFWLGREDLYDRSVDFKTLEIKNTKIEPKTVVSGVASVEMSPDGSKLLIRKGSGLHRIDTASARGPATLDDTTAFDLSGWAFSLVPREEWRQMFIDAWRLERDYFYDTNMHGVDWPAMLDKYLPLVNRVSTRGELSDLIAQMVAELSALHTFVYGGDNRGGTDNINIGTLGARLTRDPEAGGYRIEHIYRHDPDEPDQASPLAALDSTIAEGDVITAVNRVPVLSAPDIGALLRNQVGRQVLLDLTGGETGETYQQVVMPGSTWSERDLRYDEWEYTRRLLVDQMGDGRIGYVHLRAMGGGDIAQWTRDFYPVHDREALIIDVRQNGGGNIDSWILEKLIRQIWFYWQARVGKPTWNMQYAFPGHMVVLCNEHTGSDGEAFTEGFRRLGLGKVIGTRTWGGEIWLTSSNVLVDNGIATAAEFGVYGPEGTWLIEGHGVEPDETVDNLPYATFLGSDEQLDAAVAHLLESLANDPVVIPDAPTHPDKSSKDNRPK